MKKTNVDDLLIEMITPKVKEIEERFSRGEGLSNEDINTLLLKSQYNHINHLDQRLDDVSASVTALEGKFENSRFHVLERGFHNLEGKFHDLELMFQGLEGKFDLLRMEVNGRFDSFEQSVENKITQAINTNMRWSIGMIAVIVTVLKLADMMMK